MENRPEDFHEGVKIHRKHTAEADTDGPPRIEDRELKPDPMLPEVPDVDGAHVRKVMERFGLEVRHLASGQHTAPDALMRRLMETVEESAEQARARAREVLETVCLNPEGTYDDLSAIDDPMDAAAFACTVASVLFHRARQAGLHERL
jgi:hypothetical protein